MKKKIIFLIPLNIINSNHKKNFIKYNKKYLIEYKIQSLLETKLGEVYVISNSKKILNIAKRCSAKIIRLNNKIKSMSHTVSFAANHLDKLSKKNKYVCVTPIQNIFLEKKSIIKAYNKILKFSYINSLNSYVKVNKPHVFQVINFKKEKIKFDIIKIKKNFFTGIELSKNFPDIYYSSCAIRISKIKYLLNIYKYKLFSKSIIDKDSCIGVEISHKENFEVQKLSDLMKVNYFNKYE